MTSAVTIATLICFSVIAIGGWRIYTNLSGDGSGKRPKVGAYDPKTGIGRGAPGFQTNVSRIAVPAHIIARIRAGEEVSAEEITAAQEAEAKRLEKEARQAEKGGKRPVGRSSQVASSTQQPGNEWIPEGHGRASPAGGKKSKSKRG
ncbi:unnamed protein product [Jaminaea pallidilutea]